MNSIFSVQNENTIAQATQVKKEAKESKKVQFANVAFDKFISKTRTIFKNTALTDNLSNLNTNFSSKNSTFKGLNSFVSHFKINELPKNSPNFEYNEEFFDKLNELIKNYKGTKGDLKDAEQFLLNLMKEIASEIDELGFDSFEFKSYYEAYKKQLAEKSALKNEIVKLANKYLDETDGFKAAKMLVEIEAKLREYHNALQDGDLRNFFAPILSYLNDDIQESIVKALYTINEELKTPEAFELGGGARLVWEIDGERIKFKILSKEDLQQLHDEIQKSKSFKTIVNSLEKSENDENLNSNFNEANLSFDMNLNLNKNANLATNSPLNSSTNSNSTQFFNEFSNLALNLKMTENAKANFKANSNAQSLLKGLLRDF